MKKVWKPTGKFFKVDEVFSEVQMDVPVSIVFLRLKEGTVVCDREEFLWDEDPNVRRMLALIFSEENAGGTCVECEDSQNYVEASELCHTTPVVEQVDGLFPNLLLASQAVAVV